MSESLKGRVVAIIGTGSERDRAIAVALAEAGADIAMATERPVQEQEFATASIANEVWAMGREQFSAVIDSADSAQLSGFLVEVRRRLGRVDAVVGSAAVVGNGVGARDGVLVVATDGLGHEDLVRLVTAAELDEQPGPRNQ